MRWVRFSIFLLVVTLLHAGNLINTISVSSFNIKPDLLLILLVFLAVNCDPSEAMIVSFAIGFAADISGSSMGPHFISFGLFGFVISQMRKVVIMKRMVHQAAAIAITGLIAGALTQILVFFKTDEAPSNVYVMLVGTSIYSGIIGPVVWLIFSAISGWLGVRKPRYARSAKR
jgi:rod shape-determining protein MreD